MNESTHEVVRARGLLMRYAFGTMVSQTVATAAELGLPDHLGDGEATASTLAEACGAQEQSLNRLLRCLAALEIVRETSPGVFTLAPAGRLLRRDHPASVREVTLMWAEEAMLDSWRRLTSSIRTGERAFDDVFGVDFFGYLGRHPDLSTRFNAAMSQASAPTAGVLPTAYDFGRFSTIVDIGGGDGTLLSALLREHPDARGILYDTAGGSAGADAVLRAAGVGGRCETRAGDFFASVPSGGDLYVLKSVIHDWNDEQATTILRNCRDAMPGDGRLLVIEPVMPDLVASPPEPMSEIKYLSDLNMLVNIGGRERTADDFANLLRGAGFRIDAIHEVPESRGFQLIEGRPAP